ncbi:hypothetical protein J4218_06645 [Candidatus Pacearchaeota archaeon]|nr:hypothetical protein [Candidatus Pacearchaeota archaeon]
MAIRKVQLTMEELSLLGVLGRGRIPWIRRKSFSDRSRLAEREYAYNMSLSNKYSFKDGGMKGKPDYQLIADEINRVYHLGNNVRDRYSVRNALYKYRKKLGV